MPLPDEFFTSPILNKDKNKVRKQITANYPMPGDKDDEDDVESGSVWDFFEEGTKGYASGITWSASELLEDRDEPLSRWGTAGRILGETGALFTPGIGPFAVMGKAGRGLAQLGARSTPNLIKQGPRSAASAATTGSGTSSLGST